MASKSLGTLTLNLVTKIGGFTGPLDQAGRKMTDLENRANSLGKTIGKGLAGVGAAVGTAVVAGATAAAVAVSAAIDSMDELYNAAQKIGIPTEVLAGFKYAAELSGVSIDQLQVGLGKLIKFQQDAAQGGKESTRVFEAFGIAVKEADGSLRSTQELLKDFSDVFAGLKDGPEKSALALQVFGKSGLELIPLLNAGSDGIENMTDRARELGLVFDNEAGAKADEFNDKLDELKGAMGGLATQVAIELLPELIELVDWFRENYTEGARLKETAQAIASVAEFAGDRLRDFSDSIKRVTAAFAYGAEFANNYLNIISSLASLDIEGAIKAKNASLSTGLGFLDEQGRIGRGSVDSGTTGRRGSARGLGGARSVGSARDYTSAARDLQTAMPKAAKSKKSQEGKRDNSEAEALREAERAARDYQSAISDLNSLLDDQAKITGGELTEAGLKYRDVMLKIQETETELQRLGKLDSETQVSINSAREQATKNYEKEIELIQNKLTPYEQLIDDMKFENEQIGLSNAAQFANNELRRMNIDVMTEQGAAMKQSIIDQAEAGDALQRNQQAVEGFKNSFEDAFTGILDGSKSIKQAFTDLADSILAQIARMLAEKWVEQLFGAATGGGGGGGGGGGWGEIFSSFLGGFAKGGVFQGGNVMAFANGGVVSGPQYFPMSGGKSGLMGEAGPEAIMPLTRINGKLGVASSGGGGKNVTINNYVPPTTERRTAQQIAQRTEERLRTATSRNR